MPLLCCNYDVKFNKDNDITADYETHLTHGSEIPLCKTCSACLQKGKCPPAALVNDMWTGYIPEMIYTEEVSVIEMVCASPCFTSMICFSLDIRYGALKKGSGLGPRKLFDVLVHMHRHRVGAKGQGGVLPSALGDYVG